MKRSDLLNKLTSSGWWAAHHGIKHDLYTDGTKIQVIPKQAEINEETAKAILNKQG